MRETKPSTKSPVFFSHADTVILTEPRQPRAISATLLAGNDRPPRAQNRNGSPNPSAALERALVLAQPDDAVFATGSLYLVGDLLTYWHSSSPKFATSVIFFALSPSCSLSWRMIGWVFRMPPEANSKPRVGIPYRTEKKNLMANVSLRKVPRRGLTAERSRSKSASGLPPNQLARRNRDLTPSFFRAAPPTSSSKIQGRCPP